MRENLGKDKYVEGVIAGVKVKLEAQEKDKAGILGDAVRLTDEEKLVYKWLMLTTDEDAKRFAWARYFAEDKKTYNVIGKELGFGERKMLYVRRRLLDGINDNLIDNGYGYREGM